MLNLGTSSAFVFNIYIINGYVIFNIQMLSNVFLIFINDIPDGIQSNIKIFADDTSIFSVMKDSISASVTLNEDLRIPGKCLLILIPRNKQKK